MRIYLLKRSYFHFRGKESFELDILGKNTLELMQEHLGAEVVDELPPGDKVVLYPVYPLLSRENLDRFLKNHPGSFSFKGGYVVRGGEDRVLLDRIEPGLFSIADYPKLLACAVQEVAAYWAERGALVEDDAQVSYLAKLEEGVVVERGARIVGKSIIKKNARIGQNSEIIESIVGENTEVRCSILEWSGVGKNCKLGPFAYLRPNSVVGDGCRVGDFVELKNCRFGSGSKAAHLSYIGDAEVGENVNVGCGVVFANYNGKTKSKSVVKDNCFIGSNCNLIAPVTIGEGSYLAAGTTLTQDLMPDDFCIGRCRETVKGGGATKYLTKK